MTGRIGGHWKPHALVWIETAMGLPPPERLAAFRDIADLAGKSIKAVRMKAQHMRDQAKCELEWATAAHQRPLPVALGPAPTAFRWPSKVALRGGTRRLGKSPIAAPAEQG